MNSTTSNEPYADDAVHGFSQGDPSAFSSSASPGAVRPSDAVQNETVSHLPAPSVEEVTPGSVDGERAEEGTEMRSCPPTASAAGGAAVEATANPLDREPEPSPPVLSPAKPLPTASPPPQTTPRAVPPPSSQPHSHHDGGGPLDDSDDNAAIEAMLPPGQGYLPSLPWYTYPPSVAFRLTNHANERYSKKNGLTSEQADLNGREPTLCL